MKKMGTDIRKIIAAMSLEEKVGQVAIPMFQSSDITPDIEKAITRMYAGSIRYSPNANYDNASDLIGEPNRTLTPVQTAELTNNLQKLAQQTPSKIPLIINIDQEGGIETDVNRSGVTVFPSQMGFTAANNPVLTKNAGKVIGTEMRAMGLTLNQTPSLDMIKADGYKAVKTLTFGDDRDTIIRQSTAFIRGLKEGGIAVMVKHYPSYGASSQDAHHSLPSIDKSKEQLLNEDILIYKKAIEAGVDAIMVGHILADCLDPSDTPASLSEKIITGFLRNEMKFNGLVQTDAMRMRAILDKYGLAKASVMAVKAGNDTVLLRGDTAFFEEGYYAILEAYKKGEIPEERLNDAVYHSLVLKEKLGLFKNPFVGLKKAERIVGSEKHRQVSMQVANSSATLYRNRNRIIPLRIPYCKRILVITTMAKKLTGTNDPIQSPDMLARAIKNLHPSTENMFVPMKPSEQEILKCKETTKGFDVIIMATANAVINKEQSQLVKELHALKKPLIVIAMQSPHDIVEFPEISTYLCTYEVVNDSMIVASEIIFGKRAAKGKFPAKINK